LNHIDSTAWLAVWFLKRKREEGYSR